MHSYGTLHTLKRSKVTLTKNPVNLKMRVDIRRKIKPVFFFSQLQSHPERLTGRHLWKKK